MKRLEIVQLGLGHVGRAVAQIVLEERKRWLDDDIEVKYRAVSDTSARSWARSCCRRRYA